MTDEKKLPDDALDAVTGGMDDEKFRCVPSVMVAQQTLEKVNKDFTVNNTTNLDPEVKQQ